MYIIHLITILIVMPGYSTWIEPCGAAAQDDTSLPICHEVKMAKKYLRNILFTMFFSPILRPHCALLNNDKNNLIAMSLNSMYSSKHVELEEHKNIVEIM